MTSGNFLIDSESQLKTGAGMAGMPGKRAKGNARHARDGSGKAVIDRIIEFSARNRLLVVLLVVGGGAGRLVVACARSRSTPSPT